MEAGVDDRRTGCDAVGAALGRAARAQRLDEADLEALFAEGGLLELGAAAAAFRRRLLPAPVATYIIDRNINYTNVCVHRCRFCAFYRPLADGEAYLLDFEQIADRVAETVAAGGTGILLQGGVHPGLGLDYYEGLLHRLKTTFPQIHLHAFSAPEIAFVAKAEGRPVAEILARLREAGLDSIPGGGAEILVDSVRGLWSPTKATTDEWLEVHREAHALGIRTTATMMFGAGESFAARVRHLVAIRDLQDRSGGFTAFIPWTFQQQNTDLEGTVEPAGGYDYLRTLAISRLALDNLVHVQGSWVTQGTKIGQLALFFGADDLGSIMLEENVVAAAGVSHRIGQREIEHLIADAGYRPRQRRTLHEPL